MSSHTRSEIMQMGSHEPPKISFSLVTERGIEPRVGYLVRTKGQAWVYPDAAHLGKDPDEANALLLDPSQIVDVTDSEQGPRYYVYQGAPLGPPKESQKPQ